MNKDNKKDATEEFHKNGNIKMRKFGEVQRYTSSKKSPEADKSLGYYMQVDEGMERN